MLPLLSTITGIALNLANALGLCTLDTAVDSYLYARYVETPKVDSSGDFSGKDAKAAARAKMSVEQYVIGGMSWDFRQRVYRLLEALDSERLYAGITSGYRGDYRQGLASGRNKNRPGRSFHGGSLVGGWGRGVAIDLVALAPTRREQLALNPKLWAAIDRLGPRFGLGRPYGDRDAPHVAPLASREFAVAAAHRHARQLAAKRHRQKVAHHGKKHRLRVAKR